MKLGVQMCANAYVLTVQERQDYQRQSCSSGESYKNIENKTKTKKNTPFATFPVVKKLLTKLTLACSQLILEKLSRIN